MVESDKKRLMEMEHKSTMELLDLINSCNSVELILKRAERFFSDLSSCSNVSISLSHGTAPSCDNPPSIDGKNVEEPNDGNGSNNLINIICENALITAYAQQKQSVTPEIIEDIAADLRLNLRAHHSSRPEKPGRLNEVDVQRAARSLLDLLAYLHKAPAGDEELRPQ